MLTYPAAYSRVPEAREEAYLGIPKPGQERDGPWSYLYSSQLPDTRS